MTEQPLCRECKVMTVWNAGDLCPSCEGKRIAEEINAKFKKVLRRTMSRLKKDMRP